MTNLSKICHKDEIIQRLALSKACMIIIIIINIILVSFSFIFLKKPLNSVASRKHQRNEVPFLYTL